MSRPLALSLILLLLFTAMVFAMPAREDEHENDERFTALMSRSYTRHAARAEQPQIITLQVDRRFDPSEQAKIVSAIEAWNYSLNGHIRFVIDKITVGAETPQSGPASNPAWLIAHASGRGPYVKSQGYVLGSTQRLATGGGLMLLYDDALGRVDLGTIVMHELGHVLGLEHDAKSRLMSVRYMSEREVCIDSFTVQTLAILKNLPVDELNWCESAIVSAEE